MAERGWRLAVVRASSLCLGFGFEESVLFRRVGGGGDVASIIDFKD